MNLLDLKPKTISEISSEVTETPNDTKLVLQELKGMGLINEVQPGFELKYVANTDLNAFLKIAERLLDSKYKYQYDFLSSSYIEEAINDLFLNQLQNRFILNLSQVEQKAIIQIVKHFPSTLKLVLFRDVSDYRNRYEQLIQSAHFEHLKTKMHHENLRSLLSELIRLIILDLDSMPAKFIEGKKIAGYWLETDLRVGLRDRLLFRVSSGGTFLFTQAAGPIQNGRYVMYGDDESPLYFAYVLALLENFDSAINAFDRIIRST